MNHFNLEALCAPIGSRQGLIHAVLQSLYNQSESTANDRARMNNQHRGGCWANDYTSLVGSRDWTLKREKITPQTLVRAKRFAEDALAWLVDQDYAKSVQVTVISPEPNQIRRTIMIALIDGSRCEMTI